MFSGNVRPLGHAEEPPRRRGPVTPIQRYEIIRSFLRISVRNKAFASAGHDAAVRRPKTGTDAKRLRFEKRIVFPAHASSRIRTKPGEAPVSVRIPHFLRVPSGERSAEGSGTFPSAPCPSPSRPLPAGTLSVPTVPSGLHPHFDDAFAHRPLSDERSVGVRREKDGHRPGRQRHEAGRTVREKDDVPVRPFLSGLQPARFFHPKRSVPRTTICTSA